MAPKLSRRYQKCHHGGFITLLLFFPKYIGIFTAKSHVVDIDIAISWTKCKSNTIIVLILPILSQISAIFLQNPANLYMHIAIFHRQIHVASKPILNIGLRLHQMQMGLLVMDDGLLCFLNIKNMTGFAKRNIFHLGWVLPSCDIFTSDVASLIIIIIIMPLSTPWQYIGRARAQKIDAIIFPWQVFSPHPCRRRCCLTPRPRWTWPRQLWSWPTLRVWRPSSRTRTSPERRSMPRRLGPERSQLRRSSFDRQTKFLVFANSNQFVKNCWSQASDQFYYHVFFTIFCSVKLLRSTLGVKYEQCLNELNSLLSFKIISRR